MYRYLSIKSEFLQQKIAKYFILLFDKTDNESIMDSEIEKGDTK